MEEAGHSCEHAAPSGRAGSKLHLSPPEIGPDSLPNGSFFFSE